MLFNPREQTLIVGSHYMDRVSQVLLDNHIEGKIIYISDVNVDKLYGEHVKAQVRSVGSMKEKMVDDNSIAYAMSVAEDVIATDVDCIVGMGGGRVLDVCKYAAYISKRPLLSIATTLANDGIASPIAVLKRRDGKVKSLGSKMPSMLIVDTDVIQSGPKELLKAGIGDTVSNYMALMDWDFAVKRGRDRMNGYAYLMSRTSLDVLMKTNFHLADAEFIEILANSLILSGIAMGIAGSSRPVSGSEHLFSHALDYYAEKRNLHGLQVALGTVAVLKLLEQPIAPVMSYLKKFQVDIHPLRLGIDKKTFVFCMQKATTMRKDRYTYLHELDLENAKLERLYDELEKEL